MPKNFATKNKKKSRTAKDDVKKQVKSSAHICKQGIV